MTAGDIQTVGFGGIAISTTVLSGGEIVYDGGTVTGGLVKRVSPAMVHAYFDYMTSEYPRDRAGHGMLLVQLRARARAWWSVS